MMRNACLNQTLLPCAIQAQNSSGSVRLSTDLIVVFYANSYPYKASPALTVRMVM
jgi:hypothetical protein